MLQCAKALVSRWLQILPPLGRSHGEGTPMMPMQENQAKELPRPKLRRFIQATTGVRQSRLRAFQEAEMCFRQAQGAPQKDVNISILTVLPPIVIQSTLLLRVLVVGARKGCQSATPVHFWAGRRTSSRGKHVV